MGTRRLRTADGGGYGENEESGGRLVDMEPESHLGYGRRAYIRGVSAQHAAYGRRSERKQF